MTVKRDLKVIKQAIARINQARDRLQDDGYTIHRIDMAIANLQHASTKIAQEANCRLQEAIIRHQEQRP